MRSAIPSCRVFGVLLICILNSQLITALVTLGTIRNLTLLTDECRERVVDGDSVTMGAIAGGGSGRQGVLVAEDEGGEVEDVSSVFVFSELIFHSLIGIQIPTGLF